MDDSEKPAQVTLIVKNPSSPSGRDFRLEVPVAWTISELKSKLEIEYDGNPLSSHQKLIYCGQLLKDTAVLREILKNQDISETQTLHMVVKASDSPLRTPFRQASLGRLDPPTPPSPVQRALSTPPPLQDDNSAFATAATPGQVPQPATPVEAFNTPESASSAVAPNAPSSAAVDSRSIPVVSESASSSSSHPQSSGESMGCPEGSQQPAPAPHSSPHMVPNPQWTHAVAMANPIYAAAYQAALSVLNSPGVQLPPQPPAHFPHFPYAGIYNVTAQGGLYYSPGAEDFTQNHPTAGFTPPAAYGNAAPPGMHPGGPGVRPAPGGTFGVPPVTTGAPPAAPATGHTAQVPPQPNDAAQQMGRLVGDPAGLPAGAVAIANALPPGVRIARVRVVRIDLTLIIKLIALVLVLNQDGSRFRFLWLSTLALIFYLHQTGMLPLQRWLLPQALGLDAGDDARAGGNVGNGANENLNRPQAGWDEANQGGDNVDADAPVEGQGLGNAGAVEDGRRGWNIAREARMLLVGFFTSLLPGFNPAQHLPAFPAAGARPPREQQQEPNQQQDAQRVDDGHEHRE